MSHSTAFARRHETVPVQVGQVTIGGNAPVVVQSMTNTDTADIGRTVTQVAALAAAGSELVRVTVNNEAAARAVPRIRERLDATGCDVPLVGDFHFNGHKLLGRQPGCAAALGKYRINPGNVGRGEKRDDQFARMIEIACEHNKPVRIGVNWGSLDQELLARRLDDNARLGSPKSLPEVTHDALIESALGSARRAEELGLPHDRIILSCKMSGVQDLIAVYRALATQCRYALHLGLTEAGMGARGIVASTAALSVLLQQGIGDTIRVSLTASPVEEVKAGQAILRALKLREFGPDIISCPTCGRCEVDIEGIVKDLESRLASVKKPLTIAVMGCVVNGPGEAREADIGIAAGKNSGVLFKKGNPLDKIAPDHLVDRLMEEIRNF